MSKRIKKLYPVEFYLRKDLIVTISQADIIASMRNVMRETNLIEESLPLRGMDKAVRGYIMKKLLILCMTVYLYPLGILKC